VRIVTLSSPSNPLLKRIRSLHERQARHKAGLFLIESETVLLEAFAKDVQIEAVVVDREYFERGFPETFDDNLLELNVCESALFKTLATTSTPSGVVAIARAADHTLENLLQTIDQDQVTLVVCENLQDPGNLGTIIRTALAFGAGGLILTRGSVDIYNPKVVRSAMGALFQLPVAVNVELAQCGQELKELSIEVIALSARGEQSFVDVKYGAKVALLLGNEAGGLTPEAEALAAIAVNIPMHGDVESLNVAIAAGVVLFHVSNAPLR